MESAGKMKQRHKMEERKLAADIKSLQKSPGGLSKQDLKVKVAEMEAALQARHQTELASLGGPSSDDAGAEPAAAVAAASGAGPTDSGDAGADDDAPAGPEKGPSRAAKKREKKKAAAAAERAELEAYKAAAADPRAEEMALLENILDPLDLIVHQIKADGHCLFRAVSHQLSTRCGVTATVEDLRRGVAAHILANSAELGPFLPYDDTDAFDTDPEGAVKSYCSRLVSTAMWGGQPEVQALCAVLRHPITVFQAESAPLHAGTEFEPAAPLTISFHQRYYVLGDHYNSVVPKAGT